MPNVSSVAAYESGLREFVNSETFAGLDSHDLGIGINAFKTQFISGNPGYFDDSDNDSINTINQNILTEYKNKANLPRFIPNQEELSTYYEPLDLSGAKDATEKIKLVDEWKEKSLNKSSGMRPADTEDFKTHLEYTANNIIREAVGEENKTGWLGDKTYRLAEGFAGMVSPFIPGSDRFLAERLPEDTTRDDDFSSALFAGLGEVSAQAIIALGTSALAGPEAGVAAIGGIYAARSIQEGYEDEMRKSGNQSKALDVGLAGVPGTMLETLADKVFFGLGKEGVTFAKNFAEATTEAAKREVIKAAMPSLGKKVIKNGLTEATVGSIGADFTTGMGRYLASGDESYIPSGESLMKGALVEGILGAGLTPIFSPKSGDANMITSELVKLSDNKASADAIYKALSAGNYDEAVNLATKEYTDQPEKKEEAQKIVNQAKLQDLEASKNISLSTIGSTNLAYLEQQKKAAQTSNDLESAKRIEENIKAIRDGTFVNPDAFTIDPAPLAANGFEESIDPIGVEDVYDVTLDNSQKIQSDDRHIFVKGLTNKDMTTQSIAKGGVGILINEGQASLVLGKNFQSGGTKLQFSQTPRKGFAAIKIQDAFANEQGQTVITGFSILGQVQESSRSEQSKQKTKAVVEKFKPKEGQTVENQDGSGLTEAAMIIDSIEQNESFSEGGYNSIEQAIDTTINMLDEYAGKNTSMKSDIEELQNELLLALDVAKYKVKPTESAKPIRGDVDLFRQRIAEQEAQQLELGIPTKLSDLSGKQVTFQGQTGPLSVDNGLAYVGDIQIAGSEALIEDIEGLETNAIPSKPQRQEVVEGIKQKRQKQKTSTRERNRIRREGKAEQRRKQFLPTPSNITSEPEAIFESVTDEGVAVETVVVPATEPIVFDDEAKLVKEIERTKKLIADDPSYEVTLKEQEAQLALLQATQAPDVPTAVQAVKEEIVVDKKEAIAAQKESEQAASKNTTEEEFADDPEFDKHEQDFEEEKIQDYTRAQALKIVKKYHRLGYISDVDLEEAKRAASDKDFDGGDVFDQVVFTRKPKLGIQKGQVAVVDVEIRKPKRGAENGEYLFSVSGKSYPAIKQNGVLSLLNRETKETIPLGKTQEQARTEFANLVNSNSIGEGFAAQDKSNSELLKEVVYTPPKEESVEERIEKLNQKAKEAANKVISDKVDEYIATIENPIGKKRWEDNKNTIVEFIAKTLVDPKNNRDGFTSLGNAVLNRAEEIASSLDAKVKAQIEKDREFIDKKTEEFKQGEANERNANEKADRELSQEYNKIKFSIGSEQTGVTIDPKEAQDYIAKNHPSIDTVNTRKTTDDGHQWRGRTDFTSGTPSITINLANIRDLAQLKNVIHEELAHIAYNDPSISTSLKKIIASTKLRDELSSIYKEGDVFEESVVKRMADLVDSYTEKGAFAKLLTAIKSYVKDKLGMNLNDNDLSYIAYRAIVRAGKVTSGQGQTKFAKSEPSNNTNTQNAPKLFEPTEDIFSIITGQISEEKKRTIKNINRAIRKKLEKDLIVDEPQAWSLLKAVKFTFLNPQDLAAYNSLLDQFVRTRSKNRDPGAGISLSNEVVIAQASDLIKKSNQGHFDFLQLQFPFLEGKDFQANFEEDIDVVLQQVKDNRGQNDSDLPNDKDAESLQMWQLRTLDLQETIFGEPEFIQDRFNEMFPDAASINTSNPIIAENLGRYVSSVDDIISSYKEIFKQRMNQLMGDPTTKTYRELRQQYYGLMDFLSNGYALNIEDFVTEETRAILEGEIDSKEFLDITKIPMRKMNEGAGSLYANARSLGNKVYEAVHTLTKNFREGILASERIHEEFTKPTLLKLMNKAVAANGGKQFDGQQLNFAGIYSMSRAYKATEGVTEGILASRNSIQRSLKKDINSVQPARKQAAESHSNFISDLFVGIDENTPNEEALGILEANAEKLLPKGLIEYVQDVVQLFEVTKPLAKFTTEFGLGRPFDEWVNYAPSMAVNKDGAPIDVDLVPMQVTADDVALADINKDTNMSRGGMASTKERTRQLGDSKVYIYNINHLAENRMRLNLVDYLTLPQRRELNNVISGKGTQHKEFATFLKDTDGSQERVSHIQRTVRTMWSNTIQSAHFISEFQGIVNSLSNIWASTKLASGYQFFAQMASNIAPYFIQNAGNPKRIKYLFDAYSIIIKRKMGQKLDPRLEKTVDRVMSIIESRSQDQHLDKSIALDRNSSDTWEKLQSSQLWHYVKGINGLREKIFFYPFKASDFASGAPMMLANIMHHEEAAGRAVSWDGLTYNADTFIRSLDETERFIGIGASSRRGVWTNNKNGWMSILRNMLSSFSSHRINNATNAAIEFAKLRDGNLSAKEKIESLRYIMGIAGQSAVFGLVKWTIVGGFYNLLTAKMGEEDNEEELEKAYRNLLTENYRPGDKKMLEAEIAMRENIRNELASARERNNAKDIVVLRGLQDVISNTLLIPAVSDIPLNMIVHATYDKYETEQFKQVKSGAVEDLTERLKKAKANKNTNLAIELQKDLSRWEAQEAVTLVYEKHTVVPTEGLYGGVLSDAYKFMDSVAGAAVKAESLTFADVAAGAGLVGMSQPDLNRWIRMYSKIEDYEKEYVEKLKEIQEMKRKKMME